MSVFSPPEPREDELEALIREARARQRRRRIGVVSVVALAAATGLALSAVASKSSAGPRGAQASNRAIASSLRCPPGNLGILAFVRGGALRVLNLNGCRVRTLVGSRVRAPIAISPDGRWASFRGGYVAVRGGRLHHLSGTAVWSSRGGQLAVVTRRGGVETGRAAGRLRRLLPDGWGASTAVFSPGGGRLAVSRTADRGHVEAIWVFDLGTGARRELFSEPRREGAPLLLQGFSPGGRWLLFWQDPYSSASLLADGTPLLAIPVAGGRPRLVTSELYYEDYVSWCGGRLVYVVNHGGREVTDGDGIAVASPPSWRSRTLLPDAGRTSWTSFACSRAGVLAVAAGPSNADMARFGHEHRSIWLVHGRSAVREAKTVPPRHETDEWPSWSSNGKWLLFVRTGWAGGGWHGSLYALDRSSNRLLGPIASVGATENYYGYYGWSSQLSWHRP